MRVSDFPRSRVEDLLTRRGIAWSDVVRVVEVGSTAHGISTPDTGDDLDLTVVRIEPFDELVTGANDRQSMMIRTQPDGVRSRLGDIDLNVYTLRRFAHLARSGNPTILGAIFSTSVHKSSTIDFDHLARIVASKKAGSAFLGYMRQQMERWIGVRGQKEVNRPELVEAYGFDTKYAAHVIRLGYQGIEYMETGRYSVPMRPDLAERIVGLRTGGLEEYQAMAWAVEVENELKVAIGASPLPDTPGSIKDWLVGHYRSFVP